MVKGIQAVRIEFFLILKVANIRCFITNWLNTIKPNQINCNASNRIKQKYYNMTMHYIDNMIRKQANKCLYQSVSKILYTLNAYRYSLDPAI